MKAKNIKDRLDGFMNENLIANSKKNKNKIIDTILYLIPVGLISLTLVFTIVSKIIPKEAYTPVTDELYNEYSNENTFKNRVYGEGQTPNMENVPTPSNEEFAISVYGDSFCISANAQTPSFPAFISKYTNSSLVYNVATHGDSIMTMAAREGGVPFYISPCDIPASKKSVEITLENEYENQLIPDFSKNAGLNPCKVKNVEGVISKKNDKLYFTRSESGNEAIVDGPTTVTTRAMELRLNDITVFFVGSDSLYKNTDRLIEVYKKVVNNLKTDKYLIIGPVAGKDEEIKNGNEALEEAFGSKYLNLLEYLCRDAVSEYNIEFSSYDRNKAEKMSSIPEFYLAQNKNYFNETANDIVGKKIADKLKELKYIG